MMILVLTEVTQDLRRILSSMELQVVAIQTYVGEKTNKQRTIAMRSKGISMHNMHFECGQCALFQITIDEYSARPEQQRLLESEQKRAIKLVEGIFHRGLLQICR